MLKRCLVFWESEPKYAYKPYAYKKKHVPLYAGNKVSFFSAKSS